MSNTIISNPEKLKKIIKAISQEGPEKLHVLSDFDRTLTKAFVGGKKIPSLISVLRDGNYLTPDYAGKAHAFYNKYHPIEIDPKIPLAKKEKAMQKWWKEHFDLLIKSGLRRKHLKEVVESGKVQFREGASEFIDILRMHNIPLVILSSSGLGGDAISMYLEKEGKLYDNIHIISNSYEWDENGNAINVREPIIHVMNKDETAIQNFPAFDLIKNRKNVLLLGDSMGDIRMIKGFNYRHLLKIGFLNEEIERNLKEYKRNYDVVILRNSSMNYLNSLLKRICRQRREETKKKKM